MFSIVLVTYNSAEVIGDAIRSIPPGHEVIVVDNASQDHSADIAEQAGAITIRSEQNLGFGAGCNRGAARATHEALLFLNPDARLQADALEALSAAMERYPQAAAFNPRLVNPKGEIQFHSTNGLVDDRVWFRSPATADRPIPMGVGAALLFRKSVFDQLGGFDENIFLFSEDDDLSARAIKAGYSIYHIHDAICMHIGGKSTPPTDEMIAFKEYHLMRSKIYAMRKHGKPIPYWPRALCYWIKLGLFKLTGRRRHEARVRARLQALQDSN